MDRIRALEVFSAIADEGSLAGAARRLTMSAPSVTRVLGDLEAELGVLLFHRTTRAVTLTEPGRAFLEDARRITADYAEAADAARGAGRAPKGVLRLTAPALFGRFHISPIVLAYLDQYPDVSVDAVYLNRVVNLVEEGFDVAVRIGPLPDSALIATRVGAVQRVVCGSPDYFDAHGIPQAPRDLAAHRVIAARAVTPTDDWRFVDGATVRVRPRLAFSSVGAAIDAAKRGWGVTRVISYQIGHDLEAGALKTVLSDAAPEPLPVHLVHAEGRSASAKVRAFVEMAAERLRANPYLNG